MFIKIMTLDTRELSFHIFFSKMKLGTVIYSSVFLCFKNMKPFGKKKGKQNTEY